MTVQYSTALRNAQGDSWETSIGTSAKVQFWSGSMPANAAAASTGTKLAEFALASDWSAAAASGAKTLSSLPLATTGLAAGTVGYYRFMDSAGTTCHEQGLVYQSLPIATSALTAANGNVLNFTSTTGVSTGMSVSGTGVVSGTTVSALTSTTVTMSNTSTAGVANATTITFGGDITVDNASIAVSQAVNITAYTKTWPGA